MARKLDAISSEGLSDDQRWALLNHHTDKYERALSAKKMRDADFRNACKLAKAEIGQNAVKLIKLAIDLRDKENAAADLKGEMVGMMDVAHWSNARIEFQLELFDEDPIGIEERVRQAGKLAGLRGQPRKPGPEVNALHHNLWLEGHSEGQKVLASGFRAPLTLEATSGDTRKRKTINGTGKKATKGRQAKKGKEARAARGKGRAKDRETRATAH